MSDSLNKMAAFIDSINKKHKKKYGNDILFTGKDVTDYLPFHSGFANFDWVISGIGGFPRGGMTLVHGLESTGKSTFMLESITNEMNLDPNVTALYIDVESALTKGFLKFKNMHPERLTITPLNNEDALNTAEAALKQNVYDMIVIDSLAKLESEKIMEKEIGESQQRNRRAVMITEFLRRITFILRQSKTALVCINQEVQNQEASGPYAAKTTLPCGFQQKFSANLRVELKRLKSIKVGDTRVGYELQMTAIKNKIAPNERAIAKFLYMYDRGFIREYSLLEYLKAINYVRSISMGRHEFLKKELYDQPFKLGDLKKIVAQIKDNMGVDLYQIEPTNEIVFEKAENVTDIAADDEGAGAQLPTETLALDDDD